MGFSAPRFVPVVHAVQRSTSEGIAMAGKLRSTSSTVSASEAKALVQEARANRINADEYKAFQQWKQAKEAQRERINVGVNKMTLTDAPEAKEASGHGRVGFKLEGIMPDAPNDKGSFLNDNKKVLIDGTIYTLQVGLYPYQGKQSLAQLEALGVVVGSF